MRIQAASPVERPSASAIWRRADAVQEVRAKVVCRGKRHTVVCTPRGHLRLLDHDREEVRRELGLVTLGGRACRCVAVLRHWIDYMRGSRRFTSLPKSLHEVARKVRYLHRSRTRQTRCWAAQLDQGESRWLKLVPDLIHRLLRQVLGEHCNLRLSLEADRMGGWSDMLTIWLDGRMVCWTDLHPHWLRAVYFRGIALLDDALTLDISGPCGPIKELEERAVTLCRIWRTASGRLRSRMESGTIVRDGLDIYYQPRNEKREEYWRTVTALPQRRGPQGEVLTLGASHADLTPM